MRALQAEMLAEPGDVLLFEAKDWRPMTALIHLVTRSRFNHAALALGDGLMVEAVSRGISINKISSSSDDITIVSPPYSDDDDLADALAFATRRVGDRYGYVIAFLNGLNQVFQGLGIVVKRTGALICSELVAEALQRTGMGFGKDSALVSPGDLAEALGVPRK